jgi:hypothetical protein
VLGRSIFTLSLVSAGGTRELTSLTVEASRGLPSQGIYRVAPGGERLAWIDGAVLRVLDAGGQRRSFGRRVTMFRFAPDGGQLAYLDDKDVVLADLKTGERRTLGAVTAQVMSWMDWIRGGPIVVGRTREEKRTITWFPLAGTPRVLASRPEFIFLVAAAPSSTRVVWFTEGKIFAVDAASPEPPRVLDDGRRRYGRAITAELAPDGSGATWSDENGVHRIDVTTGQVTLVNRLNAQSLWYAEDGALAYSSFDNAFYRRGDEVKRFGVRPWIHGLRFRRDAPGLLVVTDHDVMAWDPVADTRQRLAHAGGRLVDGDAFRGGVVTLTTRSDPSDPVRQGRH